MVEIEMVKNKIGTKKIPYYVNHNGITHSCLPIDLKTENLVDITCHGDYWSKYLDTQTGQIHDCAEYWDKVELLLSSDI